MSKKVIKFDSIDAIRRRKRTLDFARKSIVFGGLVGLIIIYAILGLDKFFTVHNFLIIIQQSASLAIIGFGMTYVIMQGGIDLSVGSVAAVGGLASAYFLRMTNSPSIAILSAITVGLAFGFFNGLIHVRAKVPSFLVTLGSLYIGRGITIIWSEGTSIQIPSEGVIGKLGSLPYIVIIMFVILVITFIILKFTSFGRYVQALGDNEFAAKFVGINVNRVKLYIYVLCSLLAAIGGLVLSSRIGAATPRTGEQMELEVIAAVVLGGTPLTGGVGGVERTLLGVVLLIVLTNGLILLGIPSDVQYVIKGLVLIIAVGASLDRDRIGIIK